MDGHPMMQAKKQQTTKAPIRQPTGLFERNPLFDGMDDESNDDVTEKHQKPQNKPADKGDLGMDMDMSYGNGYDEPANHLPFATNIDYQFDLPAVNAPSNYLIGPMVVRVRPDGSPVAEDKTRPLPIDDDREAMTIGSGYFPSSRQPSTRLEAPVAPVAQFVPVAQASRARIMPNLSAYTNYRTITRQNSKNQH